MMAEITSRSLNFSTLPRVDDLETIVQALAIGAVVYFSTLPRVDDLETATAGTFQFIRIAFQYPTAGR